MKRISQQNRLRIIFALICLATGLLVFPQWGMMLSNSDDGWLIRANWTDIKAFAEAQKRFWMLIINYATGVPYRLGNWPLANAVKMLVNSATLFAFFIFLRRLISPAYASMSCLVWLAFIDVSNGYYSPFHGYLLMFNLPMCLLFLSFWWYLKLIDNDKKGGQLMGPYILFGFSLLAYEPMIFFSLCFPAFSILRAQENNSTQNISDDFKYKFIKLNKICMQWILNNWPLLASIISFITVYFLYRRMNGAAPTGMLSSGDDWGSVIRTMYKFTIYGFRVEFRTPLEYGWNMQTHISSLISIFFGLSIGFASWLTLPFTSQTRRENLLETPVAFALLALIALSLNSLHAMTEGYRQWAIDNPYYVGNYLSSFALAILITSGISAIAGGNKAKNEQLLTVLIVVIMGNSATSNMIKWSQLSTLNRNDAKLWIAAIEDLKASNLQDTQETLIICGKNSPEKVSGDDAFWSYQLGKELNHKIEFHSKHFTQISCGKVIDFDIYRNKKS